MSGLSQTRLKSPQAEKHMSCNATITALLAGYKINSVEVPIFFKVYNPFIPKISLGILLAVYHTILTG